MMQEEYGEIFQKICRNKSLLPAIPDTGLKILSALNHPSGNAKMFAKIIESDMGLRETYHLSLTFLSRSVFRSSSKLIERYIKEAYKLSTKVAVISYFLAEKTNGVAPSDAMLAGLFQDIGVPSILATLEAYPDILLNDQNRKECVDMLSPKVGAMIMEQWGFDEMVDVVNSRKNWLLDNKQTGLAELVLIARVHAAIGTPEFRECPPLFKIPAFHKLNLGELGPDNTLKTLSESKEELAEMERLLAA